MKEKSTEETGEVQAEVKSTHDEKFKNFFNDKEIAESFFLEYLPAQITSKLDFKSLEISKDSYVDQKLNKYFSDIVYKVRYLGNPAFIYLLMDHKSSHDPWVAFQLLKYMVRIWEQHRNQDKDVQYLPVIIPMVVYHGKQHWKVDIHFISLFRETEGLEAYIPNFNYMLYDLSDMTDEEIKGIPILRIFMLAFKYIFRKEMKAQLPEIMMIFNELQDSEKRVEYLEAFINYLISSARTLKIDEIRENVTRYIENGGVIMQTIAEKLINQGKKEGRREGRQEGRQEGLQEGEFKGKMEMASKALEENLPIDLISKLSGLSPEEIRQYQVKTKRKSKMNN